ncbi:MAG: binding domain, partial [Polaromonas sp.]|nr:binding domain [Polaromonas sp.]
MGQPDALKGQAVGETISTDVVVVGSGGAGLTAATVAARHRLNVLLLE